LLLCQIVDCRHATLAETLTTLWQQRAVGANIERPALERFSARCA
jgi:hypothetical protein